MNVVNAGNAGEVARTVKGGAVVGPSTVRRSPSIGALAAAMNKVQAVVDDPTKNRKAEAGTRGSYRYADLPAVLDAVRGPLTANGLAVMQFPCELDDAPALTTLLTHTSGEWVETTIKLRPGDTKPQSVGSALTYARRYALLALCGIAADDDDDGQAASLPFAKSAAPPRVSLRDQFVKWFADAPTREQVAKLTADVGRAKGNGDLTDADCDHLRPLAEVALKRFPQPAKA